MRASLVCGVHARVCVCVCACGYGGVRACGECVCAVTPVGVLAWALERHNIGNVSMRASVHTYVMGDLCVCVCVHPCACARVMPVSVCAGGGACDSACAHA
jgi:hypothetical protein